MSRSIGVIGAGAIGGWVAGRLALAGNRVSVLARGATADALAGGITIVERGEEHVAQPTIATGAATLGPQDIVIIAVKAQAMAEAAQAARSMIGQIGRAHV